MIPKAHILEWASKTPWPEEQQVEQDLLICRALVAIFSDDFLSSRLAFRGGTALNKIFFSGPYRYSEDIDLVQTTPEPIGPTIDALRKTLDTLARPRRLPGERALAENDLQGAKQRRHPLAAEG